MGTEGRSGAGGDEPSARSEGKRFWLRRLLRRDERETAESYEIPPAVATRWVADPSFPFLVSFPRTGSHWLRMMMELYFEKPSLTRAFYYPGTQRGFTCYHTHDLDLTLRRDNVLYLYREPVRTVFSQMQYHEQDMNDEILVRYWSNLYGLHLLKWLLGDGAVDRKTVVTYEHLRADLPTAFRQVCRHLDEPFSLERLERAAQRVSKAETAARNPHDPQVVTRTADYELSYNRFHQQHAELVRSCVLSHDERLRDEVPW